MPQNLTRYTDVHVSDIMSDRVQTLSPDSSLREAKQLFERKRFHHVVITERQKIVGVISDRDILKAISPFVGNPMERSQDRNTLSKRIHQIMKRSLVTIGPAATAAEAARKMLAENVSCLPVVDDDQQILGVVTVRDFVRWAVSVNETQETPTE